MKRQFLFMLIIFLMALITASAERGKMVPRRVFFHYSTSVPARDNREFLSSISEFLYTNISSLQPIVRVDSPDTANSSVQIGFKKYKTYVVVSVVLFHGKTRRLARDFKVMNDMKNVDGVVNSINGISRILAKELTMVRSETRILLREDKDKKKRRCEFTFWLSGYSQIVYQERNGELIINNRFHIFPVAIEFSYYVSRRFGFLLSSTFTKDQRWDKNIFVPGVGICVSNDDFISPGFSIVYNAGFLVFESGRWNLIPSFTIAPTLMIRIKPFLSLKTKAAFTVIFIETD